MCPVTRCHSLRYCPKRPSQWSDLAGGVSLEKSVPLFTNLGATYRIAEGDNLTNGFEELHADEMDIAGVLLAFNPSLDRRHACGHQR
jgi:hypothetical protein